MDSSSDVDVTERLPSESMREMFSWLALACPPFDDYDWRLGWITASHVNRRWRQILLDMPALWAEVVCVFMTEESFEALLERARSAPITLEFEGLSCAPVWAQNWAIKNLDRVKLLSCPTINDSTEFSAVWEPILTDRELPLLEDLFLHGGHDGDCYRSPPGTTPLRAISLRELALIDAHVPFYAPNLTRLTLSNGFYDPTSRTGRTVHDLLDALRPCSMLIRIDLTCAVSTNPAIAPVLPAKCQLPGLKWLTIARIDMESAYSLCDALDAPNLQFMQLRVLLGDRAPDLLRLAELRRIVSHPEYDTLRIFCGNALVPLGYDFKLCVGSHEALQPSFFEDYPSEIVHGEPDGLKFSLYENDALSQAMQRLSIECTRCILQNIADNIRCVYLFTSGAFLLDTTDTLNEWVQRLSSPLRSCHQVDTVEVVVSGNNCFRGIRALLHPRDPDFLFPRLKILVFRLRSDVGLHFNDYVYNEPSRWIEHHDNGEYLAAFLNERASAGLSLDDIQVVHEDVIAFGKDRRKEIDDFRDTILGLVGHLLLNQA